MKVINTILGIPLGYLIYFAYQATGNYGLAILIFAVFVKVVLFPVNVLTHKNSIRLLQIQPQLNDISRRYSGERDRINEEQYNLYQKEKYSPFVGLIPMLVQLVLIVGVLQVMYNPLQHMLHLDASVIDTLLNTTRQLLGTRPGSGEQLLVIDAMHQAEFLPAYREALAALPNGTVILDSIAAVDLRFLGLNLGDVPSFASPVTLLIPFLSGATALAFCLVQNAISPGALSQGAGTKWGLTAFTVAFSLYFAAVVPIGVGLYWTAGNLLGIVVAILLNLLYPPKKLAGDAIAKLAASRKSAAQHKEERQMKKQLAAREKRDAARFMTADKHLVFYALTSGQYKYYKNIIEYVLDNSNITVHYLTNDHTDALFDNAPQGLVPYYASQRKTIGLMLKLECDILVTTVQDLQSYHMKRSVAQEDIEYVYTFHGLASTHLMARPTAYDHFDTVFCVGPHQAEELRRREEMARLPAKQLVKVGYGLYDQLVSAYADMPAIPRQKPRILIAPSWQTDNILDTCINEILVALLGCGYQIIVRPHPQYINTFPERMDALSRRYADEVEGGELLFELDFSGNHSIFSSDILITDWSGIAFEFAYCTRKPCMFINTPMKVMNPDYKEYGLEVVDITLRDKVGVSVDTNQLNTLSDKAASLLANKEDWNNQIEAVIKKYLYYPGRSGEAGGKYLLNRLAAKGVATKLVVMVYHFS